MFRVSALLLVASGVASLTYQVAWVRLLGVSLGSSSASVATVIAAFFLGLSLGSYFAERVTRNRINSLKPYALLELGIGVGGLLLLPILLNLDAFVAQFPALAGSLPGKFFVAMALMVLPTICMGATFPVMAAIMIRRQSDVGSGLGQLYSFNTLGAVLGAALAGFVFIPEWGLNGAVYLAAGLNFTVAACALAISRLVGLPPLEPALTRFDAGSIASETVRGNDRYRALLILFITGFAAIATQVGWTKYLAIFTGTTLYGFAAILAIFLFGIAAGSWVIHRYLQDIRQPQVWMAAGLLALGTALLFTRAMMTAVPTFFSAFNHLDVADTTIHTAKYGVVFVLLFVPTALFGALFPLNLRIYCGSLTGVRERVGKAYAVNTLGSILGALAAGFWAIPQFGTDVVLTGMAFLLLGAGLLFMPTLPAVKSRLAYASTAAIAIFAGTAVLPHLDYHRLIASVGYDEQSYAGEEPDFLYLKESKTGVVSAVTYDGTYVKLQNNGLNESQYNIKDPDDATLIESLLAFVPYMLHDNPRSAFVVGYGGGVTARAMTLTELPSIRIVELEPAVVEAKRTVLGGDVPSLNDPRVQLEFNDARNTLLLEDEHYDIIAAQPSHPWLVRASNVFTREFWQLVSSRLTDNGVFAQWLNLFRMDPETLQSLLKSFYAVFPHGFIMVDGSVDNMMLVGANSPLQFDFERMDAVINAPKIQAVFKNYQVNSPEALLWYFALSRQEALDAAQDAVTATDTNILAEVRLSRFNGRAWGITADTREMLKKYAHMDLVPLLGGGAPEKLLAKAWYDLKWESEDRYEQDLQQLAILDPLKERVFRYEMLYRRYEFEQASALYAKYEDWPWEVHLHHAVEKLVTHDVEGALTAVARISDPVLQRAAYAEVFFRLGEWEVLDKIEPASPHEARWHAVGASQYDIEYAGQTLSDLADDIELEVPHLRLLVRYHSSRGNDGAAQYWARQLIERVDEETGKLREAIDHAMENQNEILAKGLIEELERINPQADVRWLKQQLAGAAEISS